MRRLHVAYVSNSPPTSGVGKPAVEILQRLRAYADLAIDHYDIDADAHTLRLNGRAICHFRRWGTNEPKPVFWWRAVRVLPRKQYDLWHFTNQTISFAPQRPKVVTVFDLIELVEPQRPFSGPIARLLYSGIPRAEALTATSRYTREMIGRTYSIKTTLIALTPLAAGPQYRPIPNVLQHERSRQLMRRLGLPQSKRILLYVGSEHPRKNLVNAVKAIALARSRVPGLHFLKVGPAGTAVGRTAFLHALETEGLSSITTRAEKIEDGDLPYVYNLAGAFVFPSLFEGFGIPPLEAMQCGCPVIVSNRTSLPEVVGDAGVVVDPFDHVGMANAVVRIFQDPGFTEELRQRGLRQAQRFSWEQSADTLRETYLRVVHYDGG